MPELGRQTLTGAVGSHIPLIIQSLTAVRCDGVRAFTSGTFCARRVVVACLYWQVVISATNLVIIVTKIAASD